jgi:hypothetical protein
MSNKRHLAKTVHFDPYQQLKATAMASLPDEPQYRQRDARGPGFVVLWIITTGLWTVATVLKGAARVGAHHGLARGAWQRLHLGQPVCTAVDVRDHSACDQTCHGGPSRRQPASVTWPDVFVRAVEHIDNGPEISCLYQK